MSIELDWRNSVGGHGEVIKELNLYMRDIRRQGSPWPDLIVIATDANCTGLNDRTREIAVEEDIAPLVLAIPDPHIERWLLLDGAAFKAVFGHGCDAPHRKCERGLYKQQLIKAVLRTGTTPSLGGIEYADDIIQQMDLHRVARQDESFDRFVSDLFARFRSWR